MPCESSLEWLSVPYSLPWNAASCHSLQPGNALHHDCPLLFVTWQAASFIVRPQCDLWAIPYGEKLALVAAMSALRICEVMLCAGPMGRFLRLDVVLV